MSLSKICKVDDNYTVNRYDNGYMVEVTGADATDSWIRSKIVCNTIEELVELINNINKLPLNT